jgi:hypothetical protein
MSKKRLFQYAVLWQPTTEESKEGKQPKLVVDLTTILAVDQAAASLAVAMDIPKEYKEQLDQIEIAIRPF